MVVVLNAALSPFIFFFDPKTIGFWCSMHCD